MKAQHWTLPDLELLPDDGSRYEIVDAELHVSKQPDMQHQIVCGNIFFQLKSWSNQTQTGIAIYEPGIIFTNDNAVVPDVVWISNERFSTALQPDGKFHSCPELVVEALSPGLENERRDREIKLRLFYSRRGAKEYWVVNWQERSLEVYQRQDGVLELIKTLDETDTLQSPLLPEFKCSVGQFFITIPRE